MARYKLKDGAKVNIKLIYIFLNSIHILSYHSVVKLFIIYLLYKRNCCYFNVVNEVYATFVNQVDIIKMYISLAKLSSTFAHS